MSLYNTPKNNTFLMNRDTLRNLTLCDDDLIKILLQLWINNELSIRAITSLIDNVRTRTVSDFLHLNHLALTKKPGIGKKTSAEIYYVVGELRKQKGEEKWKN